MPSSNRRKKPPVGSVTFVGAGPGDPALLTLRAVEALAQADAVVLDTQAREQFLVHARPDVLVLDAAQGPDGLPLGRRTKLVVDAAKAGHAVVRLVDGDPGLFGGLAEEAAACVKANVPFEVVPGVSPAIAAPAYAGIPLTDARTHAVHVVSAEGVHDFSAHADPSTTVVVVSSVADVDTVVKELLRAGRDPNTPSAVIRMGTTTEQRTVTAALEDLPSAARAAKLAQPVVTVVGPTVAHRETLSWFETKPLFGWRVLVPRTREQAGELSARLRRHGAVPDEVPTISVEPPRAPQQMDRAIQGLVSGRYLWVAFTSVNAVRAIREKFEEYGLDARAFAGIKVAAVGEQTAAALLAFGVRPDLVPAGEQSSAGLLEDWPEYDRQLDPLDRVFLPRADIATETLAAGLVELGWEVDDVTAYRTVRAAPPPAATRDAIKTGGFDAVVFTSSSTVRNLVGIAGKPHATTVIACIGPQTAKTAEEHGLRVDVLADKPSVVGLADALAAYGAAQRLSALEAGEVTWRPSQRRGNARRKAT
ncbi:MAG TPA: bifunctional uroporphyrinogen-III C-methyltransferase/uroporphyrinogen-III synthase [Actinomycetes bacterium]|nr:bifunctional uroporphyrinogen-III C-methyltransferase/uroporphyrinogen-III synthase [Actinomycetes bacterium]